MLYKVRVREVLENDIMVEAETEEDATMNWQKHFGDADFDEIVCDQSYVVDVEEAE